MGNSFFTRPSMVKVLSRCRMVALNSFHWPGNLADNCSPVCCRSSDLSVRNRIMSSLCACCIDGAQGINLYVLLPSRERKSRSTASSFDSSEIGERYFESILISFAFSMMSSMALLPSELPTLNWLLNFRCLGETLELIAPKISPGASSNSGERML